MKENELYQNLEKRNLTLSDACEMIYNMTGSYLQPRHIRTRFDKSTELSKPTSAAFKLFFKVVDHGKV